MSKAILAAKEQVLWGCQTMCRRGYVLGTAGNISARVEGEDLFVITPTSFPYEGLSSADLVVADMNGDIVEGEKMPSIEFTMHRGIILKRPDVRCIVHTHSKFATAASSIAGVSVIPVIDIETVIYIGGDIPIAPFAPPGSEELAENVANSMGTVAGILMEAHGAVGVGRTMKEAMIASDNIERTCEMFLAIKACGEIKPLPEDFLRTFKEHSLKKRGLLYPLFGD
ncbi:MAG: class II aldolase/adducin family protein [Desulfovibrio sp.]|jgi:L-ribulose-5-phosphate 4-epimerase|nr:class II aldolase/adducin family protein [Desulfovibrio sp.]